MTTSTRSPDSSTPTGDAVVWTRAAARTLLAITAVAIVLRLLRVEQWSFGAGEAETWRAITVPLEGPDGFFASDASRTPLVPLLLRWLVASVLPGTGEGWLRLPFAFVGAMSVPLLGLLAARLVGLPAALGAAALLALHPAHVAASQTAEPVVVAVAVALAAGSALRRSRVAGVLLLVVALGCDVAVWPLLAAGVALLVPEAGRPRVARVAASAAVLAWFAAVHPLGMPLACFAAAGVWLARPAVALVTAVPAAALAIAQLVRWQPWGSDAVQLVPGACVLTSLALLAVAQAAREHLPGSPRLRRAAAALPALLAATWLLAEVVLYASTFQGARTPWRDAARLALASLDGEHGIVVGALAGSEPLRYYLRPAHHAGGPRDPHPGIDVRALPADPEAALDELLAGDPTARRWLVLRSDEAATFTSAANVSARLQQAFALHRVVACPRAHGDGSVFVWRLDPTR